MSARVFTAEQSLARQQDALGAELGPRDTGRGHDALRYDVLGAFAQLAADGRFTVPVARTFALDDWRAALDVSLSGRARGKLVLLPGHRAAAR